QEPVIEHNAGPSERRQHGQEQYLIEMDQRRHQGGEAEEVREADADRRLRRRPAFPQVWVLSEMDRVLLGLRTQVAEQVGQPELLEQGPVELLARQREIAPVA